MRHFDIVQWDDYVRDLLEPADRTAMKEHLASGCQECADKVNSFAIPATRPGTTAWTCGRRSGGAVPASCSSVRSQIRKSRADKCRMWRLSSCPEKKSWRERSAMSLGSSSLHTNQK